MKNIIFILLFFPSIVFSKETIMECDLGYYNLILKHNTNLFNKHKLFVRTNDLKWRDLKAAYEMTEDFDKFKKYEVSKEGAFFSHRFIEKVPEYLTSNFPKEIYGLKPGEKFYRNYSTTVDIEFKKFSQRIWASRFEGDVLMRGEIGYDPDTPQTIDVECKSLN